jgi:hypothetical protein
MPQRQRATIAHRPLQSLELPDAQVQGPAAFPIANATGQRRLHQPGPGYLLAAHRESLHEGMTFSRSS